MDPVTLALPPAFGFVIGWATNALAIRMLFRPYRERRFLGLSFQGMIPRRKADIARTVARVVTSELLKEERVAERLLGPEVRAALERLAVDLGERYLREAAPGWRSDPARRRSLEKGVEGLLRESGIALEAWLATPEGGELLGRWLREALRRSPEDILPGERALVSRIAAGKLSEALASPLLEPRIREFLSRTLVRMAATSRTLAELLPPEVHEALREAVEPLVPVLLRRFEDAVLAPGNVERIKGAVRSGIVAYLREHRGGVVKNLVRHAALLARDRIFQEADAIVDANLFRLRELVQEEESRARLRQGIAESLERVLRRTPGEILAAVPPEALDRMYDQAAGWVARRLSRPEVADALAGVLDREIERWFAQPLAETLAVADPEAPERWVRAVARWARGGGLRALLEREADRAASALVRSALERPGPLVPPEVLREVAKLGLDHLMPQISARIPEILRIVDVEGLVEREIRMFSAEEVERVILQVAHRELRAITWWGGVLGAIVGAFQSALLALGG